MRFPGDTHKGEILNFGARLTGSLFPVAGKLSFLHIPPIYTAAWTTGFATLFFFLIVTIQRRWRDILHPDAWKDVLFGGFIIGVLYWGTVFWGLQYTSAGNAAIILLMEIFFTFLFFGFWKKEKHTALEIGSAILMVLGALLVLFPGKLEFHKGDAIILLATVIPPLGNHFQQQARRKVSAAFVMFGRSLISTIFLFLIASIVDFDTSWQEVREVLPLLLAAGIIIFGISKILFVESLYYISVSKAIAMTPIEPAFTIIFAYFLLQEVPTFWQILGFLPIVAGLFLLTRKKPSPSSPAHETH